MRKEIILVITAITMMGRNPVRVTHGTSSSVIFTRIAEMTKENNQRVMRRRGNVTMRSMVPRIRFTSPSTTAKMRALMYPF